MNKIEEVDGAGFQHRFLHRKTDENSRGKRGFVVMVRSLICGWACLALSIAAGYAGGKNFYVAGDGNDAWSGRLAEPDRARGDGPLASLEAARDAIRKFKQSSPSPPPPITVWVRGGKYERDRAFELTAEDSGTDKAPIVYRNYPGETVWLIGGRRIDFYPAEDPSIGDWLAPEAEGRIYEADLQAAGLMDYGRMSRRGFGISIAPAGLELFFHDRPMQLARWPNRGWLRIADAPGGPHAGRFTYSGDRPERWVHSADIWVHGFWYHDWADSYESVRSIDVKSKMISTKPPHGTYGYKKGGRFYFLNVYEELDSPGEWYLDRAPGKIHFWPPEPIDGGEAYVSTLRTLIEMKGTSRVEVRGLILEVTRGDAVVLTDCTEVAIADCTIRNIGNRAVVVTGGRRNRVTGCEISECGDGGIVLQGGDRKTLEPGLHEATNNHIHHYSRWSLTYRPAVMIGGVGNRIAHNLIHDGPHDAIQLGGNEHVIEYNEIHDVCLDTSDVGAFYMGRDWTQRGNVIRYNFFHHIGRDANRSDAQAVYLDDWSSATRIEGNVFYKAGRGVLIGGGRDNTVVNNIFVDCRPAVHLDARGLGWAKNYFDGTLTTLFDRLEAMNYRAPPYSERYPKLLTLLGDEPAVPKGNRIVRNVFFGGRWLDLTQEVKAERAKREIVEIRDNFTEGDPGFVDVERMDFRLKKGAPPFDLGFEPIPFDKIGPVR